MLALPNVAVRQQAQPVDLDNTELLATYRNIAVDLFETMYLHNGVALAAPQVGLLTRIVVVDGLGQTIGPQVLLNPQIIERSAREVDAAEGCLSIPSVTGRVFRAEAVTVHAYDLHGEPHEYQAKGWLARILQHEIDHLDGTLYPDLLQEGDSLQASGSPARRRAERNMHRLIQGR